MKIQINKAIPVVQPPDTFTLTGTLEELSALKSFTTYYAERPHATPTAAAAKRFIDSITTIDIYKWNDASKLFLPE